MRFKDLFTFFITLFLLTVHAQSNHEDILFTIDEEPVSTSEFIRVYSKNLDLVQDESQKDVDEYLTLFTNYKLKLKEARSLELHKKASYIRELGNYKKQLAKNFVSDNKVTDALVEEAYQRVSNDVKANHILIRLSENASPQDTLVAYNNILKLRDRTLNEDFEGVRKEVHNGKTIFGEELGYFSGFKMVYKFENVAFNTAVGEISKPFRTRFGYHFLKVFDKRKSRGECTVSHIMISNKQVGTLNETPEIRIQEIYKKLNQGEEFEALAKQFSEDKSSASKGGLLAPFSSGQLSSLEFEDKAFNLKNTGDVSEPFKTDYGWHIVKLINRKPIPPFQDMKPELEVRVKRDERSKLINDALVNKLKARYDVADNYEAHYYFISILNDDYFKRVWKLPENFKGNRDLFKIGSQQFTYKDFGNYLIKTQRTVEPKSSFKNIISKKYQAFLNSSLIKYQEDNLEFENKEFANIVNEYRDGLLLFDLMETTIWNTAKTDSLAIQNFYNSHKNNYVLQQRADAVVASSSKQKTLKKVSKFLEQGMALEQIKNLVNSKDEIQVIFTSGVMDANHQALPKQFKFKKGVSKIYNHNNTFVVIQVKEVLPQKIKSYEESKGAVIGDYQAFKEENWLMELGKKYKVVINNAALEKVKNQIKNK